MHTVRINTYNQNIAPQGTALPQANIPGGYHLDAYTARHLGNVSNALQDLAGLELRMKEFRRADALNMARTSYLNDIIREEERLTRADATPTGRGTAAQRSKQKPRFLRSEPRIPHRKCG